jgi:3',5'-nucleoside bisphosphate phosphatase
LLEAGIRVFSLTDHDTVDALDEGAALAHRHGLEFVTGIEITAVAGTEDVHVLGYGFDPRDAELLAFLDAQREQRMARVRAIGRRLAELGVPVAVESLVEQARRHAGRSIGRPQIASLLVESGHVRTKDEAFERWLKSGAPAFVPRQGPSPAEAIVRLHRAGGLASLAHPGTLKEADVLSGLVPGLDAIEVFHASHGPDEEAQLLRLAQERDYAVTGGSDYHGGQEGERSALGGVGLPPEHYEATMRRAAERRAPGIPARFRPV